MAEETRARWRDLPGRAIDRPTDNHLAHWRRALTGSRLGAPETIAAAKTRRIESPFDNTGNS